MLLVPLGLWLDNGAGWTAPRAEVVADPAQMVTPAAPGEVLLVLGAAVVAAMWWSRRPGSASPASPPAAARALRRVASLLGAQVVVAAGLLAWAESDDLQRLAERATVQAVAWTTIAVLVGATVLALAGLARAAPDPAARRDAAIATGLIGWATAVGVLQAVVLVRYLGRSADRLWMDVGWLHVLLWAAPVAATLGHVALARAASRLDGGGGARLTADPWPALAALLVLGGAWAVSLIAGWVPWLDPWAHASARVGGVALALTAPRLVLVPVCWRAARALDAAADAPRAITRSA
ncbi:MAG: hypothetical protein H6708_26565 [Kofleriaceae bacterium]|nr:hypothetical protein [Kofleriaceae bacterium]